MRPLPCRSTGKAVMDVDQHHTVKSSSGVGTGGSGNASYVLLRGIQRCGRRNGGEVNNSRILLVLHRLSERHTQHVQGVQRSSFEVCAEMNATVRDPAARCVLWSAYRSRGILNTPSLSKRGMQEAMLSDAMQPTASCVISKSCACARTFATI